MRNRIVCTRVRIFGWFVNINFNMITLVHFFWYCLFGYEQTLVLSASYNPAIACHFLCAFARSHSKRLSISSVLLLFLCKSRGIFACGCRGPEWMCVCGYDMVLPPTHHTLICRNSTTFLSTYLRFLFAFIFPFPYIFHWWIFTFRVCRSIGVKSS